MEATELTSKVMYWENLQREADRVAEIIKSEVMAREKTFKAGNASASYSGGRRSFDYEGATDGHEKVGEATVSLFTEIVPQTEKVDWKGICQHVGIKTKDIPFTKSEPKVTMKLLEVKDD